MLAATYHRNGPPEVIRIETLPDPVAGEGEVLVRVRAISIEGGDLLSRQRAPLPRTPHVVGYAAAGDVVAVGTGVGSISVGDRVTTFGVDGSHAELRIVRPDHCWRLPDEMSYEVGAVAQISMGTAYRALVDLGRMSSDDIVLIRGVTSPVGIAALQFAKAAGAHVIATARDPVKAASLKAFGLDTLVTTTDDLCAATAGRQPTLLADMIGGDGLQDAIDCLAIEGRAVLVGAISPVPAHIDALQLLLGQKTLIGCMLGAVTHRTEVREMISRLLRETAEGKWTLPIAGRFPLAESVEAHRFAERSDRAVGRVVIIA
jgi:NADPH2:quinone reductase